MNGQRLPLVLALTGACVFSVGSLLWLARDLMGSSSTAGGRPSLLELLEEVGRGGAGDRERPRPAPMPPDHPEWNSPLAHFCPAADPLVRRRLEQLSRRLRPVRVRIHPTNFGDRFLRDAYGNPVDPTPRLVVLHETVYGLGSAVNTFLTPHPDDEDQVSYHTLVGQNGQVLQVLDPDKRAFGAGYSAFDGQWVVTNPKVGGSVNNFALHLSLETPLDGENEAPGHSGYTEAQYDAMALVLADWMRRFGIPSTHITTHRHIDLGGERADPRSFDWQELQKRLVALGQHC